MFILFKQIDYGCGAREYFNDLVGQQRCPRLNLPLLQQGAQEPGLQLDRGRLGHLLFLVSRLLVASKTWLCGGRAR